MGKAIRHVPFKVGRRALVYCPFTEKWNEGEAIVDDDGVDVWRLWSLDDNGEATPHWVDAEHDRPTALLPAQCSRCFEVGTHEDGCMVEVNLARNVPKFWAPWAMWAWPDNEEWVDDKLVVCGLHLATGRLAVRSCNVMGLESRSPLIALGPNGPTLAPWGP